MGQNRGSPYSNMDFLEKNWPQIHGTNRLWPTFSFLLFPFSFQRSLIIFLRALFVAAFFAFKGFGQLANLREVNFPHETEQYEVLVTAANEQQQFVAGIPVVAVLHEKLHGLLLAFPHFEQGFVALGADGGECLLVKLAAIGLRGQDA